MPQLDVTSYFPQFVWFLLTFFFFYFCLVFWYLPRLATLFEIRRSKKCSFSDQEIQGSLQTWTNRIQDQYTKIYLPPLSKTKNSLTQTMILSQECVNSAFSSYKSQTSYVKTYLKSLQSYCSTSFAVDFFLYSTIKNPENAVKNLESHFNYSIVKKIPKAIPTPRPIPIPTPPIPKPISAKMRKPIPTPPITEPIPTPPIPKPISIPPITITKGKAKAKLK